MNKLMIGVMMLCLSACGIPQSMNAISDKMVGLNDRIDVMVDNTTNMQNSIKKMSDSLGATSNGIHAQALTIALNEMLKPENTKYITLSSANPIPMIPAAKGFAEIATQEELAGIVFIFLTEINNCQVDSMVLTKEQKDKYDLDKFVKLTALQLISAFAPEQTIKELIQEQIVKGGNYVDAAYAIITLRSIFIKDVLLDQLVSVANKLHTPAQYDTALNYLDTLRSISSYHFSNNLRIKIYGFYDTENQGLNQTIEADTNPTSLSKYYKLLWDKVATELKPEYNYRKESIRTRIKKGL